MQSQRLDRLFRDQGDIGGAVKLKDPLKVSPVGTLQTYPSGGAYGLCPRWATLFLVVRVIDGKDCLPPRGYQ